MGRSFRVFAHARWEAVPLRRSAAPLRGNLWSHCSAAQVYHYRPSHSGFPICQISSRYRIQMTRSVQARTASVAPNRPAYPLPGPNLLRELMNQGGWKNNDEAWAFFEEARQVLGVVEDPASQPSQDAIDPGPQP